MINIGVDNAEYVGSPDHQLWESWRAKADVSKAG
jgi:hypothetical protein